MKKIIAAIMTGVLLLGLCACGRNNVETASAKSEEPATLKVAYQYGMPYATIMIMQEKNLIEKHYDGKLTVEWVMQI